MSEAPAPAPAHGRAGRNLGSAIGVGLGLGAYVVATLMFFKPGFVALVAVALALGSIELWTALKRHGLNAAIVPILVGIVPITAGSYLAGQQSPVVFSTTSVLLASLALTVLGALVWRLPGGAQGYVTDVAASLMIIGYVPLLGSFAALMLAGENGSARMVTFLLVVVMSDTGGYVVGVLFGRHPMVPTISPKKSWEGFGGSITAAAVGSSILLYFMLDVPFYWGLLFGAVISAVAVLGDLAESMLKRDLGIKDMSQLLPGHGGLMDRLDSILFAVPTAYLLLTLIAPPG